MQAQSEQFHIRLFFAYSIFYTLQEIVNLAREFCRQRIAFGLQASRYVFGAFARRRMSGRPMPKQPPQSAQAIYPAQCIVGRTKSSGEGLQGLQSVDLWRHATQTVFAKACLPPKLLLSVNNRAIRRIWKANRLSGPPATSWMRRLRKRHCRKKVYVTSAVKHFKWEPRGKLRIHKKPNAAEIAACRPWLDPEIVTLHPKIIVCLGATAGSRFSRHPTSRRKAEKLK
jgi:hypothetical protein